MAKPSLQVLTLDQSEEWDQIVRSFSSYDTYYLSGYVKAFHVHGDGDPLLFYYNDGTNRGINVSMKRSIIEDPHFKGVLDDDRYFDLATPYGYGGWLIENIDRVLSSHTTIVDEENGEYKAKCSDADSLTWLFRDYERWCLRNNIVSEFVRFHPMIGNHRGLDSHYDIIQLGEVVHMDLSSPEIIWGNISSKNRNMIRKAVKNDVNIFHGRFPEIYKRFKAVYDSTMEKDDAEEYYYFDVPFYDSICNDLENNSQLFWAEKNGEMIAASIMLECNGFMNYHLSGSLREYNSLAPTNLLLYKAALWGSEHGMKTLYLGGGVGSGEDSLFKFKRSFYKGEELHHFHIGRKVFDPDVYQELTMIRGESIANVNYFPVYRG